MDTLHVFSNIVVFMAGNKASDTVVLDIRRNAQAIRHLRGKAKHSYSYTSDGTGRDEVVVAGSIEWVWEQVLLCLAHWISQVLQGKQVTVKTLAWGEKKDTFGEADYVPTVPSPGIHG